MNNQINNNRIPDNEIKRIQLGLLKGLHEYCSAHGLKYYMAAGTLIGAVRHKGFIPWDDDIDVVMLRDDYDKLLKGFNNDSTNYKIISNEIDREYKYGFIKLYDARTVCLEGEKKKKANQIGVNIDVFPLDYLGDDYNAAVKLLKKIEKYTWIIDKKNIVYKKRNPIKQALYAISRLTVVFSYRWLYNKIYCIIETQKIENQSTYIGEVVLYSKGEKEVLERSWFSDRVLMEFEGEQFYAPIGYNEYLERLFGNYMELPPEEERITHHYYKAFWRNLE